MSALIQSTVPAGSVHDHPTSGDIIRYERDPSRPGEATRSQKLTAPLVTALFLSVAASILALTPSAQAQEMSQTVVLQPGWSAVWLEVEPSQSDTDTVFANLPVASVWTPAERLSPVDFIQNPSEEAFNEAGWLAWFHPSRQESFLGNLFKVTANRAYLINNTNSVAVNWTVSGRPSLGRAQWVPDSYNLRGLPVDDGSPPTFLDFFRDSDAHFNTQTGNLEAIHRLVDGTWTAVSPEDPIRSGEAYWIYTRGASAYTAPIDLKVELGDGLDYGLNLTELTIELLNNSTSAKNIVIEMIAESDLRALSYYEFTPTVGGRWRVLPAEHNQFTAESDRARLRLGVRRDKIAGETYSSILRIRDGAGTSLHVPVTAERFRPPGGQTTQPSGLWVGSVTLNGVSEPHSTDPTAVTPTTSQLNMRLMIHVDNTGQARLLKEVIQMWRDGTYTNDANGDRVVELPGKHVLLTDDSLVPFFKGSSVRDGEEVGRRLTAIGYDFPSANTDNYLPLTGALQLDSSLTGTITLPFDHPRNPFTHKYHPDHDNLTARFDGPAVESHPITRQITLEFPFDSPDADAVPDFGYNELSGIYKETINGLHKTPIQVSGRVQLTRISVIAQLNPSPTP